MQLISVFGDVQSSNPRRTLFGPFAGFKSDQTQTEVLLKISSPSEPAHGTGGLRVNGLVRSVSRLYLRFNEICLCFLLPAYLPCILLHSFLWHPLSYVFVRLSTWTFQVSDLRQWLNWIRADGRVLFIEGNKGLSSWGKESCMSSAIMLQIVDCGWVPNDVKGEELKRC